MVFVNKSADKYDDTNSSVCSTRSTNGELSSHDKDLGFFDTKTIGNCGQACNNGALSWSFVWCYERCYKEEYSEHRRDLASAASQAGACLKLLKKASQYADHTKRLTKLPHALVTDWREVKVCMDVILDLQPEDRPGCTIVVCEAPKQFARASRWAQSLSAQAGLVRVCPAFPSLREVKDFLDIGRMDFDQMLSDGAEVFDRSPTPNSDFKGLECPRSFPWIAGSVAAPWSPGKVVNTNMHGWRQLEDLQPRAQPVELLKASSEVVDTIMRVWTSCTTAQQLEDLLRSAQPDHYEE